MIDLITLTETQQKQLDQAGYLILPQVLSPRQVADFITRLEEIWTEEREEAGAENYIENQARRLANLVNKGDIFRLAFRHPAVLGAAAKVVGPHIRLSMLNARDVPPHSDPKMPFHCDTDNGLKADQNGYNACTAIWMLNDFTRQNGATRLVPGSHLTNKLPKEVLADPYAPHPDEVLVAGKAGDVFIFNGHCWHTGGANMTGFPRRAILVHYVRAGYPCRLNPGQDISQEVQAKLDPLEREILGLDD